MRYLISFKLDQAKTTVQIPALVVSLTRLALFIPALIFCRATISSAQDAKLPDSGDPAPTKISAVVHGGASEVSGSLTMLDTGNGLWIVDCGSRYASGEETEGQADDEVYAIDQSLPEKAAAADAVFLTHAHLDHIGRLLQLFQQGYRRPIHMTQGTATIAPIILRMQARYDSFRVRDWVWSSGSEEIGKNVVLHWMDCEWSGRIKNPKKRTCRLADFDKESLIDHSPCKGCASLEVELIEALFTVHKYDVACMVRQGVSVTFIDAGHIPGSASLLFEISLGGETKRILFSGDLGNSLSSMIDGPKPAPPADAVFLETTYGAIQRKDSISDEFLEFRNEVGRTLKNNGIAWIPAHALDRTQKILHQISIAKEDGAIPASTPVYCLSPTAREITGIYRSFAQEINWLKKTIIPQDFSPQNLIEKAPGGKLIDTLDRPCILITTSGMKDFSFSEDLLPNLLRDSKVSIFLVCWQDPASPGGQIAAGKKEILFYDKTVNVEAAVFRFECFSGHGDSKDINNWLAQVPIDSRLILVHGEAENLKNRAKNLLSLGRKDVMIAKKGEPVLSLK